MIMYPPTHMAFGYLVGRKFIPRPLKGRHLIFLGLMCVLPDLVDKTLHYQMGLFQSGRNTFHNIFLFLFLFIIYSLLDDARTKFYFRLVLIGFGTHLVGDLIQSVVKGTYTDFSALNGWYLFALFPLYDPKLLPPTYDPVALTWETILTGLMLVVLVRDFRADRKPGVASDRFNKALGRNHLME